MIDPRHHLLDRRTLLREFGRGAVGIAVFGLGAFREVMTKAMKATASAGVLDAPNITSPRAVKALKDGDALFGLTIIDTPGHTPGHISILEPVSGILVAGDALRTSAGAVVGPDASYTADMAEAQRSVAVAKLAAG